MGRTAPSMIVPYGGGEGMVMKAGPIFRALQSVERLESGGARGAFFHHREKPFTQNMAWDMAEYQQMILVCGRYEGVDERVRSTCIDMELSIGDYVLNGGELAAMVVIEAVSRLIPDVFRRRTVPTGKTPFENGPPGVSPLHAAEGVQGPGSSAGAFIR